ncbi:hypothetical protein [Streptomyces sp. NPDC048584]|uniref:hypothetical protein n=1 Tax=Streptomyces sp. NPDC048584 TaxID=3365573 RepID=UPI00371F8674
MFEYALHRLHHEDLLRRAADERQAREALRHRRRAAVRTPEPESHPRHHWFTRAA